MTSIASLHTQFQSTFKSPNLVESVAIFSWAVNGVDSFWALLHRTGFLIHSALFIKAHKVYLASGRKYYQPRTFPSFSLR